MWLEYFIDAFSGQLTVFMILISISGFASVLLIARIALGKQNRNDRNYILGAGLFALFLGLLVFPIENYQTVQLLESAGKYSFSFSPGYFYQTLVPLFYGLFWFLVSLIGWTHYKIKAQAGDNYTEMRSRD
jgi:hypothetical protein